LKRAYETESVGGQAQVIDREVARLIAEQEVGPEHVGHAPNPYPKEGGHILYAPDALVGGVGSQQLNLIKRYRRLRTTQHALSMFCVALRIVSVGNGIGIGVFEEVPGSRHGDVAGFNLIGYRMPEADEVDEWSDDLEILDADEVLAPLPFEVRSAMTAAMEQVDPFWPSFCESHTLTWR
jgi:hypothetical protein